jgi:hypothetical protein
VLTSREVSYALYGAYLLARRNPTGLMFFDRSVDGCRRSFVAAVILYPFFLILLGLSDEVWRPEADAFRVLVVHTIAYVTIWAGLPLGFFGLARLLDREENFFAYLTAYNWSQLLQVGILLAATGLKASGLLPPLASGLVSEICVLLIYFYCWYIARVALHISGLQALSFVLLDLVTALAVNRVADALS